MRLTILILLLSLGVGYFLTYHVIKDEGWQWYAYFVTNDLKALLVSIALMITTYKTKEFAFAVCAGIICLFDFGTQVLNINEKGNWIEILYKILLALTSIYVFVKYLGGYRKP